MRIHSKDFQNGTCSSPVMRQTFISQSRGNTLAQKHFTMVFNDKGGIRLEGVRLKLLRT